MCICYAYFVVILKETMFKECPTFKLVMLIKLLVYAFKNISLQIVYVFQFCFSCTTMHTFFDSRDNLDDEEDRLDTERFKEDDLGLCISSS